MKIQSLTLILLFTAFLQNKAVFAKSANDSLWTKTGFVNVTLGQYFLKNWANGGESSLSALFIAKYSVVYALETIRWENVFETTFGFQTTKSSLFFKTQDVLFLSSKFGVNNSEKFKYSIYSSFRSQFANGYANYKSTNPISHFMAPAYFHAGFGLDLFIVKPLNLFISPLMLKAVVVNDDSLSNMGAFGVKPAERNANGTLTKAAERFNYEAGVFAKANFSTKLDSNISLNSNLELFTSYKDQSMNLDFIWTGLIVFSFNKYLAISLGFEMKYDEDAVLFRDMNNDGIKDELGPRTQFKESFGFGLHLKL